MMRVLHHMGAFLFAQHGAYGVMVSTEVCGTSSQGSNPCRHPKENWVDNTHQQGCEGSSNLVYFWDDQEGTCNNFLANSSRDSSRLQTHLFWLLRVGRVCIGGRVSLANNDHGRCWFWLGSIPDRNCYRWCFLLRNNLYCHEGGKKDFFEVQKVGI